MTARQLALEVLIEAQIRQPFVQELLDQALEKSSLSPVDRRLATTMVYGTIRQHGTLDVLLGYVVSRHWQQIEPPLLAALRLGAYQLCYLDQIPSHAAVHETVELAEVIDRPKAKGFLNGSLRALTRLITEERSDTPSAKAYLHPDGGFRLLNRGLFPRPREKPADYLAGACSFPIWLTQRWIKRYGFEESLRLTRWFSRPPELWLRCNSLKQNRAEYLEILKAANIEATPGQHHQSLLLGSSISLHQLPGWDEGRVTVQDESAMHVASMVKPVSAERILDLCAAPGGKTTHLAELMKNEGEIVACDIDERRLERVTASATRLGLDIIQTKLLPVDGEPDLQAQSFDAVLVDVPCSNTGVLGRRPEARWRIKPKDIFDLSRLQKKLLLLALKCVKKTGRIVYSTCSIEPEENQNQVRALRVGHGMKLDKEHEQIPGKPSDGGYRALLRIKQS